MLPLTTASDVSAGFLWLTTKRPRLLGGCALCMYVELWMEGQRVIDERTCARICARSCLWAYFCDVNATHEYSAREACVHPHAEGCCGSEAQQHRNVFFELEMKQLFGRDSEACPPQPTILHRRFVRVRVLWQYIYEHRRVVRPPQGAHIR